MASTIYEKILAEAQLLSPAEVDKLIVQLKERKSEKEVEEQPRPRWEDYIGSAPYPLCGEDAQDRPRWEDFRGSAPYPLCGEDAQEWVTRTRRESDEHRKIR
jgi:hypothetical protein